MFSTDADNIRFLLEAEADLSWIVSREELLHTEANAAERPKYVTNYIGSKQNLIDWIWVNTPDGAKAAVDAFSGSSVVGYMYKSKGLAVQSMDRLHYCHHIARAIVENDNVTLSEDEIETLLADHGDAKDFVRKHFGGVYFESGVHKQIDIVRSNLDKLSGYKKDIALFALGKTCITAKGGFGHFGTTQKQDHRADSPAQFRERFQKNCQRINALVFEGAKSCKAHHGDTRKLLGNVNADIAYFDPPYATQFSQTNYERAYHFVEGLMTWWEGKKIRKDSVTRAYEIPTEVTKTNAKTFFEEFLGAAKHIPHWIISYRDQAYPSEPEIKKIVADNGKSSRMKSKTHQYHISASHGENSLAKERIFVCAPGGAKADVEHDEFGIMNAEWEDEERRSVESNLIHPFAFGIPHWEDSALLEALAAPKDADAVRVTAFMGNKYFILDFLWQQTPKNVKSVLDAFSGGANVGYFYKKKGLRVVSNDKLHYPHHIARALIENHSTTLSDEDIESIFADPPHAGSFCVDHFYGYYFTKPILHFLDLSWANIQALPGYKKDLALTALGWTVVGKAKFGQFSRSKKGLTGPVSNPEGRQTSLSNIPLSDFQHRFRLNLARVNKLVFDNGQENKATRLDAVDALKKTDCDLAYADPPYITQFGANDYELNLHFVEGLMTMWEGKELHDNARRDFESGTRYTRESIGDLIADLVKHAGGKHLLLSYRDKAFPDEKTIHGLFKERFKQSRVKGIDVEYGMIRNEPARGGKHARELIFIGSEPLASKAENTRAERYVHTRITGEVDASSLGAHAEKTGDKRFTFILTHKGTNRNGDHFTAEELRQAAETAIGKKIDLSHSQEFRDIVGGIVESRFIEDGEDSRVECVGELFTEESEPARLAYKLMKRGIVSHVSMECDYREGECSICGRRIKNKAEYCIHLKNHKGKTYKGKPCFEILHDVTFTGMGLLDREGADERAAIERVASAKTSPPNERNEDMAKSDEKRADTAPADPSELSETEKMKLIQKQELEIERLTKELEALRQKLEETQAEQRRNARKAKAQDLIEEWEARGRDFSDDEARKAEIDRLMALSDDAFEATLTAVKSFAAKRDKNEDDEEDEEETGKPIKKTTKKNSKKSEKAMKGKADLHGSGAEPDHVADNGDSLANRLSAGFMAAYKDRAGIPANE